MILAPGGVCFSTSISSGALFAEDLRPEIRGPLTLRAKGDLSRVLA